MAALLTVTRFAKPGKLIDYLTEVTVSGVKLLPLDINESTADFLAEKDGIRFSLCSVKGLGEGLINGVVRERTNGGRFTSFYDFCVRTADLGVTVRTLEALIKCGSLDCFGYHRSELLAASDIVLEQAKRGARDRMEGQLDFFGGMGEGAPELVEMPRLKELDRRLLLEYEREVAGMYLSGHPLDEFQPFAECAGCIAASSLSGGEDAEGEPEYAPAEKPSDGSSAELLVRVISSKQHRTKKGDMMCFVTCEDKTGSCEIIVFPQLYQAVSGLLGTGSIIHAAGRISAREDEPAKLMADLIEPAERFVDLSCRRRLCVRADSRDTELMDELRRVIGHFADEHGVPVGIWLSDLGRLIQLKNAPRVRSCTGLIQILQSCAGVKNVLYMKEKK